MINVYKEFDAIQFDGSNNYDIYNRNGVCSVVNNPMYITLEFYIGNILDFITYSVTLNISDWLVYSPYKDEWKVYTDKEFQEIFKRKEEL